MKENIVYKGSERRVIVVKSASSKHFEEAHFFLKSDEDTVLSMPDLLHEANRIVERSLIPPTGLRRRERRHFWRGFGLGIALTGAVSAGFWVLLCLI